jgi:hypothetical protein
MRSGNHAIIDWILNQHAGHPVCFLNNVKHGDHDPYTARYRILRGIKENIDDETLRYMQKRLLVYSYEDRKDAERPGVDFISSVFDPEFEANRKRYLGASGTSIDVLVIRDPFNCISSRLKLIETRGSLGGSTDMKRVVENWKCLAKRAVHLMENPTPGTVVVNFNRWVNNQSYREELSHLLGGTFNDSSMERMSVFAGGSSFEPRKITPSMVLSNWKKLFVLQNWRTLGYFYKRFTAPKTKDVRMRTSDRWKEYRDAEVFQTLMKDASVLELSEQLFGELPGTREFVRSLQEPDNDECLTVC